LTFQFLSGEQSRYIFAMTDTAIFRILRPHFTFGVASNISPGGANLLISHFLER